MPRRQDRRIARIRYAIVGFVALLVVGVLGYGLIYSTGITRGEFVAGEHYRELDNAPGPRPGEPLLVREFFSYGCVHCRNFDPQVERWKRGLPDDVRFERAPVVFSPSWALLAQTYFALEQLGALERNHDRLFRAIHDNNRQFLNVDAMADFISGNGATREEFLEAFNSPTVRLKMRNAEREQRELQVPGVPSLLVANRYMVGMNTGRRGALDVVDHLLEQERERASGTAAERP